MLLFAVPFSIAIIFYLLTLCRTVYTGDSGELTFAIYTMGIAHPPGYPLLTLLGKAFLTLVPVKAAFGLNLLSALLSASAVGAGAHLIRIILYPPAKRRELSALAVCALAAAIWGFSNALWASAVGIEVYALGILLFELSFLALLSFLEKGQWQFLLIAGYLFLLGMTNHLTMMVLLLPIVYVMISSRAPIRVWMILLGLAALAAAAYLYIPIRSAQNPIADWDHPANLSAMIDHITARRYQSFVSGIVLENYIENLWRSIRIWADQAPLIILLLGLPGLFVPSGIKPRVRLLMVLIILFNLLTVALYDIPDIEQYLLPTFFLSVIGIAALIEWLFGRLPIKSARWAVGSIISLLVIITLTKNFPRNDQSENRLAYTYGMNILNCVPPNSILISVADNSNSSLYYLHYVEGIRRDLEIYDPVKTIGMLKKRLGRSESKQGLSGQQLCYNILSSNPDKSYLVKEHMLRKGAPFNYHDLTLTPRGMVYKWGHWPLDNQIWNKLEMPSFADFPQNIDFKGLTMLCNLYLCRGEDRQALGDTSGAISDYREARRIAENSIEASVHNSLGVFLRRSGWPALADQEYDRALKSAHLTAFEKANILVNKGNLKKDERRYGDAIDFYDQALAINQANSDARYNLALPQAYQSLGRGKPEDAVGYFENALSVSRSDPRVYLNLGILYDQNLGDTARAIDNYRHFVKYSPPGPEVQAALQRIQALSTRQDGMQ